MKMHRYVIDTNVLINANKSIDLHKNEDIHNYPRLIESCIKYLHNIMNNNYFVILDNSQEIMNEYRLYFDNNNKKQGAGDIFFCMVVT